MDLSYLQKPFKLKEQGQSTVEYILLFAVVATLVTFVFKSDEFQALFGEDGRFGSIYKREIEYSYRHALKGSIPFSEPDYNSGTHDSYVGSGSTRFFGAREGYGE